ncbi:MAG: secretin N-terminal domain-containing protein [Pseudomonadota bacterium]
MRFVAIILLCLGLGACASVSQSDRDFDVSATNDKTRARLNDASLKDFPDDIPGETAGDKVRRFFSREGQREIAVDGDPYPELEGEDRPGRGGIIDTERFNQPPRERERIEFVGSLSAEPQQLLITSVDEERNLRELREAGARPIDPDERVEIRLENDTLEFAVRQLLGGLLSVNYVAATSLEGTVTFQTERPIRKSLVPSVLRDILASNGYVMKLINGVYQIGTPEVIQRLETNTAVGETGDLVSKVITLRRGSAVEVATVVASVLPLGASVTPVESNNSIILRATPVDLPPIEDLIRTLVNSGVADDLIAVIPLKESPPEQVAASILAFYQANGTPIANIPVVIPLENQQSLLVGAKSTRSMANIRSLIQGLDKDLRDAASLRIIPLKHLPADEIATQLNAIFGTGAPAAAAATQSQAAPSGAEASVQVTDTGGADVNADANTGGDSVTAPSIVRRSSNDRGQGAPNARAFAERQANADPLAGAGPIASQADQAVSIVPDTRNNALLVFSTFRQFRRIREVVNALDLPLAQVVIEATIVEVEINDQLGYGVQAFLESSNIAARSSTTITPVDPGTAGGFAALSFDSFGTLDATVVLSALQAITNVQVISSPYLTVLDGRAARLSIGDQVPFLLASSTTTGDGDTTVTNEVEVRDTGIILEVTPRVNVDNSVLLNISQEVSSVVPGGLGTELTPTISQRSINSDVVVRSGKTVILGGLIEDEATKTTTALPVVGRIPVIGNLFKQTQDDLTRSELLVMITPRVIRKASQLDNITRQLRSVLTTR